MLCRPSLAVAPGSRLSRRGFTLIELLVVITVIAILAAIAIPSVSRAIDSAKKARAATVCNNVALAIGEFEREWHVLPDEWEETMQPANASLMDHLIGTNQTINRSGNKYYEGKITNTGMDGMGMSDKTLYDPWGQVYQFAADADGDGQIQDPYNSGNFINASGLVHSPGRDGDFGSTPAKQTDNPKSW